MIYAEISSPNLDVVSFPFLVLNIIVVPKTEIFKIIRLTYLVFLNIKF